jgi:tetratricopeptide (TPR) repeat protein
LVIGGYFRKFMKIKPLYLYLSVVLIAIVYLLVSTQNNNVKKNISDPANKENHSDEIQQGMNPPGQQAPSKSNVSGDILRHMEFLKKAVEESPNDTARLKEYADFLYMAHQNEKALPVYERLVKLKPNDIDARFTLTSIFYENRQLDKAEKETDIILSYDKNNPQALYNKGAIVAGKGEKEKAQKIWNDILSRFPESEAARLARSALQKL